MSARKLTYYAASTIRGDDDIIYCAFDTETDGLGGELLSIQYGTPYTPIVFDASENMIDNFYKFISDYPSPCVWYAHFAQYDWRYLMDYIIERKLDVSISMRTDNDVYQITFRNAKGKKVVMRDSYALFNSPLKKLATSFCPELPKGDLDFEKETFNPLDQRHIDYAKRDVQILLTGLPRLARMLHSHFGVNPNATFASTSLKGWQATLSKDTIYNSSKYNSPNSQATEEFIRQAYYGGLVFLTDTRTHKNCTTYDINSSYPYAMCTFGVPDGRCMQSTKYNAERMGIYRCRVKAPDNLRVAILLARDSRGSMRQFSGEFETVCTSTELIFAAQNGYKILEIYEGIIWEEIVFPFNDYIEKCKSIRVKYHWPADQGTSPEEYLAKFMQNSLYGKFGSRRERTRMIARHTLSDEEAHECQIWDAEEKWVIKPQELDKDMRCMPHWAVFITAHARLKLLSAVYSIGTENVLYGDTDSITVKAGDYSDVIAIGNEYGQWKPEKQWSEFRAIAPKVYAGILTNGKRIGAAKGLPRKNLTEHHWQELLEDGKSNAQAMSLSSLKVSLRKGSMPASKLTRKSSTLTNSANFIALPDGTVRVKMRAS